MVLIAPPDYKPVHSQVGIITQIVHEYFSLTFYNYNFTSIRTPCTNDADPKMVGHVASLANFVDWRKDVIMIRHVPAQFIMEEGLLQTLLGQNS
jgi:hypothetical protein